MRRKKLKVIEMIEILDFKHKIKLTKEYADYKIELIDNYLYIERCRYE